MSQSKIKIKDKNKIFKLYDYNVYDTLSSFDDKNDYDKYKDNKKFQIQAFAINSDGKTASIIINGFKPFFYIKVGDDWSEKIKTEFIIQLKKRMGNYYENSIVESKLIKRNKLNMFDNKKLHTFLYLSFTNTLAYNKAKKIFYDETFDNGYYEKTLKKDGFIFNNEINPL